MAFHPEGVGRGKTAEQNRAEKQCRVRKGQAHAALVYDGARCVGWCQFGPPDELPRIKNHREYRDGLTVLPDWRITCFFTDKAYRRQGVTSAALNAALDQTGASRSTDGAGSVPCRGGDPLRPASSRAT